MKKLVFATQNTGKAREIHEIMGSDSPIVLTMEEASIQVEIVEDGASFTENALIKVRAIGAYPDAVILGDDSGLEIDFFNGEPGIYSARYAALEGTGEAHDSQANMNRLLRELEHTDNRNAQFHTVICLILDDQEYLFDGIIKGQINREKRGTEGFGYDPIFQPEGYSKTFAELGDDVKNTVSHRAKAVQKLVDFLQS